MLVVVDLVRETIFWNSRLKKWHDTRWRRGNRILKLNFEAAAELIRENLFLYMRVYMHVVSVCAGVPLDRLW